MSNGVAEFPLVAHLGIEELRIEQSSLAAVIRLEGVRDKEVIFMCLALLLRASLHELFQFSAILGEVRQKVRKGFVAEKLHLRDGKFAAGTTGIARDEDEVSVFRAIGTPVQIIAAGHRFSTFVDAQQADVEIKTRKIEIVGIAAELCHCEFWREH